MSGKAVDGLANADANLFRKAPFAFTPLPRTSERAIDIADQLAAVLGANPLWLGPKPHDSWVATTSHLPYILATALVLATETEASHLVGPGFHSSSRLAGSPSSVEMRDQAVPSNLASPPSVPVHIRPSPSSMNPRTLLFGRPESVS